jgi:hypothetical protein
MEFIVYNKETVPGNQRSGEPTVRLHRKTGLITLSKEAALMMGLTTESKVGFLHDPKGNEWYIRVSDLESDFKLRTKDNNGQYTFNSVSLVTIIQDKIKKPGVDIAPAGSMKISRTQVDGFWPIITATYK